MQGRAEGFEHRVVGTARSASFPGRIYRFVLCFRSQGCPFSCQHERGHSSAQEIPGVGSYNAGAGS
jgi:hypothetical protein